MTLTAAAFAALAVWLLVPAGQHARAHLIAAAAEGPNNPIESFRRWIDARGEHERRRLREIAALTALSGELNAGQPPAVALFAADPERRVWPKAIAALAVDADVGAALRADGERQPFVRSLAACWATSSDTGAGLAAAVASLADSARAAEVMRGDITVQLAGPKATARMLTALPLLGIAMGQLAGSDPIAWLLTTPVGLLCLVVGAGLDALGFVWTRRIAMRVEAEL